MYRTFETASTKKPKKENNDLRNLGLILALVAVVVVGAAVSYHHGARSVQRATAEDESLQILNKPYVMVMGSDALNKAYNILRGRGADPAYARDIGQFTLKQNKMMEFGNQVYLLPDQMDAASNAACLGAQGTFQFYQSSSVSQVNNFGYAQSFGMAGSGVVAGGQAGQSGAQAGAVGGSMALFYGNAVQMQQARAFAQSGFGYASNSFLESSLYDAFVAWQNPTNTFSYNQNFLNAVSGLNSLGSSPAANTLNLKFLDFANRFGIVVIRQATYGAKCSMTTYMSAGAAAGAVSSFVQAAGVAGMQASVFGAYQSGNVGSGGANVSVASGSASVSAGAAYSASSATSGTFGAGYKYEVGGISCQGQLQYNLCAGTLSAPTDNPIMTNYVVFPVAEIAGAGFTSVGKSNFYQGLANFMTAFIDCGKTKCNNNGYCLSSDAFFDYELPLGLFDGHYGGSSGASVFQSACVCFAGNTSSPTCA